MALFRTPASEQPVNIDVLFALSAYQKRPGVDTYVDVARALTQGDLLVDLTGTDSDLSAGERIIARAAAAGIPGLPAYVSPSAALKTHPKKTRLETLTIERMPALDVLGVVNAIGARSLSILAGAGFDPFDISAEYAERMLSLPTNVPVKTALSRDAEFDPTATDEERARRRTERVVAALAATIDEEVYFATEQAVDAEGNTYVTNFRTTTAPEGGTYLLAFTSGLEVQARNPEDAFNAITVREVLRLVREDPQVSGIVLNAASPYLQLSREHLSDLL